MNSLRGMPIAAAVNPNVIFPDNANTTTTVVPLAMNLHRRVLTMVRFCESIPITSSSLLAYTIARVPCRSELLWPSGILPSRSP